MDTRYTLRDLIEAFAKRANVSQRRADTFVKAFFEVIQEGLDTDGFVKIKNFGTFKVVQVSERQSVNVNTGEPIQISSHRKVTFTPDEKLKNQVNRPFSHFETVILNDDVDLNEIENVATSELTDAGGATPAPPQTVAALKSEIKNAVEEVKKEGDPQAIAQRKEEQGKDTPASTDVHEDVPLAEQSRETEAAVSNADNSHQDESVVDTEGLLSDEVKPKRRGKNWWWIALLILLLALLAIFYFVGRQNTPNIPKETPVVADTQQVNITDTLKAEPQQDTIVAEVIEPAEPELITQVLPPGKYRIVGTQQKYVVKKGETLMTIAERVYGARSFAQYIIRHNNIKDPDNLWADLELNLPELELKK